MDMNRTFFIFFGLAALVAALPMRIAINLSIGPGMVSDSLTVTLLVVGIACLLVAWNWTRVYAWNERRRVTRAVKRERSAMERQRLDEEVARRLNKR